MSLSRASGSGLPYRMGQSLVLLEPLRLRDWGSIEQWMLHDTQSFRKVPSGLSESLQRKLLISSSKFSRKPLEDIVIYGMGEGLALSFWLAVRGRLEFERIEEYLREESTDRGKVSEAVALSSGVDQSSLVEWSYGDLSVEYTLFLMDQSEAEKEFYQEDEGFEETEMDWRRPFRKIAEAFQCLPSDIGELTIPQWNILMRMWMDKIPTPQVREFLQWRKRRRS